MIRTRTNDAQLIGGLIVIYLTVDPIYDALTVSVFNVVVAGFRISDWISLFFLGSISYLLIFRRTRLFYLDGYAASILLLVFYRGIVDSFYEGISVGEDAPRMFLNLMLYVAASVALIDKKKLIFASCFTLLIYGIVALQQVSTDGLAVRATAIFLIPNFLAFNALNMFVLFRLSVLDGVFSVAGALGSVALILLSKTRTVIITLMFFFGTVRSNLAKYGVLLVMLLFYLAGAGETVRISSDVDDFWNFDGRVPIWIAILDRFDDFNLLWGTGSDALRRLQVFVMYDELGDQMGYLKAQNHYLQTIAEIGLVGLFIWMAGIYAYLLRLIGTVKWSADVQLGYAYLGSLLVIQVFENDIFVNPTVSIILGLLVSKNFRFGLR